MVVENFTTRDDLKQVEADWVDKNQYRLQGFYEFDDRFDKGILSQRSTSNGASVSYKPSQGGWFFEVPYKGVFFFDINMYDSDGKRDVFISRDFGGDTTTTEMEVTIRFTEHDFTDESRAFSFFGWEGIAFDIQNADIGFGVFFSYDFYPFQSSSHGIKLWKRFPEQYWTGSDWSGSETWAADSIGSQATVRFDYANLGAFYRFESNQVSGNPFYDSTEDDITLNTIRHRFTIGTSEDNYDQGDVNKGYIESVRTPFDETNTITSTDVNPTDSVVTVAKLDPTHHEWDDGSISNDFTETSITYYMSADGGRHWEQVTPGRFHRFEHPGSELRWKAVLESSDDDKTPVLEEVKITIDVPPDVTIETPQQKTYSTNQVSLNVSANDEITSWKYQLNGGSNTTFTPNTSLSLPQGSNRLVVYAVDSVGKTDSETVTFIVDSDPRANISFTPQRPVRNQSVTFTARNSTDPDGSIVEYRWDFDGDGIIDDTSDTATILHAFPTAGDRVVRLEVVDGDNLKNTTRIPVSVLTPASFEIDSLSINETTIVRGEAVTVNATITNVGDLSGTFQVSAIVNESKTEKTLRTLGSGESDTVSFSVDTAHLSPGSHDVGIRTPNASDNASITVLTAKTDFQIEALTVTPSETVQGEEVTIEARVRNNGTIEGTQTVELTVSSGPIAFGTGTEVTISEGGNTTVTFPVNTSDLDPDSYSTTVTTANDTASDSFTVLTPANVSITGFMLSETTILRNETVEVTTTLRNTGDVEGAISVPVSVNHTVRETKIVTVPAHQQKTIEFNLTLDTLGNRRISVDSQGSKTVEVVEPITDDHPPTITNFTAVGIEQQKIIVRFNASERLTDLAVELRTTDGFPVKTLTKADFTNSSGTYTATYCVCSSGIFDATLVTAADAAGNDGASNQTATAVVDTDPPTITIDSPTEDAVFSATTSNVTIRANIHDSETRIDRSTVRIIFDGDDITTETARTDPTNITATATGLTSGTAHTVTIMAADAANNTATTTVNFSIATEVVCHDADCGTPTDPDGDGVFEDVNGNGREDFDDVVTLFENMDDSTIRDHVSAYDFNQNGRIDFDDLVELFKEI